MRQLQRFSLQPWLYSLSLSSQQYCNANRRQVALLLHLAGLPWVWDSHGYGYEMGVYMGTAINPHGFMGIYEWMRDSVGTL